MDNELSDNQISTLTIRTQPPPTPNTYTYLTLYCFIFFVFGLEGGSIGPVIPYLSKQRKVQQTSYSFLFTARTIGSIVGFIIYKFIENQGYRHVEHRLIVVLTLINVAFMVLFVQWASWMGEFASLAVFGGGHYGVLAVSNICVLAIGRKKAGVWVILVNALFGVGALTAPQIIRFWGLDAYYFYGILYFIVCLLCLFLKTPMAHHNSTLQANTTHQQVQQNLPASKKLQLLIATGLFLIAGIQMTVSGWIPSYAVMVKILNRKEATVYGTLFWSVSTIFRFVAAALTIRNSIKLKSLLFLVFVCSCTCFVLNYLQYFGAAALVGSLCYGMACSAVFPLLVSISLEYKIQFSSKQISNMMIAPVLSSMCIAGVTGRLMHEDINMLFYSLLTMSTILMVDGCFVFRLMQHLRRGADRVQITHKQQIERLTQIDK